MKKEDLTLAYKPALVERRPIFLVYVLRPMKYVPKPTVLPPMLLLLLLRDEEEGFGSRPIFKTLSCFCSNSLYTGEGSPPVLFFDIF